jgi:hypothetical protein
MILKVPVAKGPSPLKPTSLIMILKVPVAKGPSPLNYYDSMILKVPVAKGPSPLKKLLLSQTASKEKTGAKAGITNSATGEDANTSPRTPPGGEMKIFEILLSILLAEDAAGW